MIVFANSFDANIPPGYLVQGSRQELLQRVEALRDALSKMSPDQLKVHEITEDDRRVQMSLYKSFLPTSVRPNNPFRTDATRRNKTSRWKNRAQRKPAQSGDAVFDVWTAFLRPRNRSTFEHIFQSRQLIAMRGGYT